MINDPFDPPTIDEDYEHRVAEAEAAEEEKWLTLKGDFCGVEWEAKGSDLIVCISVPIEKGERLSSFFGGPALVTLERRE